MGKGSKVTKSDLGHDSKRAAEGWRRGKEASRKTGGSGDFFIGDGAVIKDGVVINPGTNRK